MEKKYGNKYEVACAILEKLEQGGSGGGGGALVDGTKFKHSTFSTVPEYYDFSEITNFYEMFRDCDNLTTIGNLDMSNGTDFRNMFYFDSKLTTIGNLDMSNGTNYNSMCQSCTRLTTVGNLKTANGTNFSNMFDRCGNLTTIGNLETENGTDFGAMLYGNKKLTTVQQLNLSNGNIFAYMFYNCTSLENITLDGSINRSIDFGQSTLLTYDSIKSILTACAATTNTSSKTLKFSRTIADSNGELATLIGSCTDKGWTITGLTLE